MKIIPLISSIADYYTSTYAHGGNGITFVIKCMETHRVPPDH